MPEPTYGLAVEDLWDRLPEVYRNEDEKRNWVYKRWLAAILLYLDVSITHLNNFYYQPISEGGAPGDSSDLVDANVANPAWYTWIAMVRGIQLDTTQTVAQQKAALLAAQSYNKGTANSIIAAVQPTLTGSQLVRVYDHAATYGTRGADNWYDLLVVTRASETTIDPVATCNKAGVKPAGVVLRAATVESTWDEVETANPTWTTWDTHNWNQIEEAGF